MAKRAGYKIVDCGEVYVAEVSVSWDRVYGRCDRRTHFCNSTLYTRKALRAWGKRHGVDIPEEEVKLLPTNI